MDQPLHDAYVAACEAVDSYSAQPHIDRYRLAALQGEREAARIALKFAIRDGIDSGKVTKLPTAWQS